MYRIPKVAILIETSRTCERSFLRGIAKYSSLLGPWTVCTKPQFYLKSKKKHFFQYLLNWGVQGIVASDTEIDEEMIDSGIPIVSHVIKHQIPGLINVIGDTIESGRMAADHFLKCGLQNFAFYGFGKRYWSEGRMDSFRDTVEKAGFETHIFTESESLFYRSLEKTQLALSKWLCALPKPIGLMTCADDFSQHAVEACKITNINIPDEISIIGVDNDELVCSLSNPTLSSISLNFEAAGYQAATILNKMMKGQKITNQHIIVQANRIVERQSSNILAIDNKEVVNAILFIQDNAKYPIQVPDVVNATSLSRRSLELEFKKHCKRSIHNIIKHYRITLICKMLTETKMTISQIVQEMDFADTAHFSRYFHESMNIRPSDYRKKHAWPF